MIPAEGILAGVVERQYARDAYGVLQRDRQRGTQTAGLVRIVAVTRFHGRIAVDDGLTGFRYPARHALAGLPVSATQPAMPWPMGISSAEKRREFSPLTKTGSRLSPLRT